MIDIEAAVPFLYEGEYFLAYPLFIRTIQKNEVFGYKLYFPR